MGGLAGNALLFNRFAHAAGPGREASILYCIMLYYIILIPRPTLTFGKKTKNTDRQISSPYKAILLPYVAIIITIVYVLVTFLYY